MGLSMNYEPVIVIPNYELLIFNLIKIKLDKNVLKSLFYKEVFIINKKNLIYIIKFVKSISTWA